MIMAHKAKLISSATSISRPQARLTAHRLKRNFLFGIFVLLFVGNLQPDFCATGTH